MTRFALILMVLSCCALAQEETLRLADGRLLPVISSAVKDGLVQVETALGPLVFPESRLAGDEKPGLEAPAPLPVGILRVSESAILQIESDLDRDRHEQLAQGLEIFARYLQRHYALDEDDLVGAPYRVRAWRRRADFKAIQERLAPAISERKGRGFGEGVAGFYAPDLGEVHFWDGGSGRVGARMELAQHELTHLFNHLLTRAMGRGGMPTWFEEGSAVYYSMTIADETLGGASPPEPLEHEASLVEVISDLEEDRAYGLDELLAVSYERFLGREYSWGWALVRELRQVDEGRCWPRLLDWLRQGKSGMEGFDAVLGSRPAAFEKAWRRRLSLAAPLLVDRHLRRNERLVAVATAMKEPSSELARSYRSIALSYASVEEAGPAIAFFEAAWRGGVEEAPDRLLAARLRARRAGVAADEAWPADSLVDLRRAVELDSLLAEARFVLGEQLALTEALDEAARQLGFGLYLADEGDDAESAALALLRLEEAALLFERELLPKLPHLERAFAKARLYRLQEDGRFQDLLALLEEKAGAGTADFEELLMLADLELLVDRPAAAAKRLRDLLLADPRAHHLRPRLARALLATGDRKAALALRAETARSARDGGLDLGFVLDRIDAALEGR